jgi:hypothetical protein
MVWLLVAILVLAVLIYRTVREGTPTAAERHLAETRALTEQQSRTWTELERLRRQQEEEDLKRDPAWKRMCNACIRAGYDVPANPSDPGWVVLRSQVHDDLGVRWSGTLEDPDADAITRALEAHARGLRRLNRIRRSLGFGRMVVSPPAP